jgi:hypothetical protein
MNESIYGARGIGANHWNRRSLGFQKNVTKAFTMRWERKNVHERIVAIDFRYKPGLYHRQV